MDMAIVPEAMGAWGPLAAIVEAAKMPENDHARLEVATKGFFFRQGRGEEVDLTRRRALRLMLWALVEKHLEAPGTPVAADALVAAAWPGERILARAARYRLHTAIRTLRDLGLRDAILTRDEGYLLDPKLDVRSVRPF